MADQKPAAPTIAPIRLQALADGVFAIVMTLLVLELGIPLVREASISAGLARGLLEMWPEFLSYILSFLLLGVFWLMHHMIFDSIRWYNTTLSWLNIVFLMFVALLPFSTALFGEYRAEQTTAQVYGVNLLLVFIMASILFRYATGKHRLVDDDINPGLVRGANIMGIIYCVIIIIGIGLSFVSPLASFIVYGLIVVTFGVATALGKWEMVVGRPVSRIMERKKNPK